MGNYTHVHVGLGFACVGSATDRCKQTAKEHAVWS